jgi:histidinol phosphatase-like PHP family hydrolase
VEETVTVITHSRTGRRRPQRFVLEDPNLAAASLLYDMAALQSTERSRFGYKRAARALVDLGEAVADLAREGRLRDVPFVGPSSARIVEEFLASGASATVDAAVERSPNKAAVTSQRELRHGFLSAHLMRQVLEAPAAAEIVSVEDFRGDFQMHSTWSDGGEPLESMVEACLSRGHSCMGITDHSHGLPIARGMSMEAVARQHLEIDSLNRAYEGRFRVFKGIEANILADGSLDLQPEERRLFEFVVASPHALLRRQEDQTARMLAAVRAPHVAMLGHPRGRVFNTRAGVRADWPRVFAAAAEAGVAIEIDGNWHRQDLDYGLAADALEAGCLLALDSDAHSIGELRFTDYAIAHARLAGAPADRVINCWSDERLLAWMGERQQPSPRRPARSAKAARAPRVSR